LKRSGFPVILLDWDKTVQPHRVNASILKLDSRLLAEVYALIVAGDIRNSRTILSDRNLGGEGHADGLSAINSRAFRDTNLHAGENSVSHVLLASMKNVSRRNRASRGFSTLFCRNKSRWVLRQNFSLFIPAYTLTHYCGIKREREVFAPPHFLPLFLLPRLPLFPFFSRPAHHFDLTTDRGNHLVLRTLAGLATGLVWVNHSCLLQIHYHGSWRGQVKSLSIYDGIPFCRNNPIDYSGITFFKKPLARIWRGVILYLPAGGPKRSRRPREKNREGSKKRVALSKGQVKYKVWRGKVPLSQRSTSWEHSEVNHGQVVRLHCQCFRSQHRSRVD